MAMLHAREQLMSEWLRSGGGGSDEKIIHKRNKITWRSSGDKYSSRARDFKYIARSIVRSSKIRK
jgi:hypothetical protein